MLGSLNHCLCSADSHSTLLISAVLLCLALLCFQAYIAGHQAVDCLGVLCEMCCERVSEVLREVCEKCCERLRPIARERKTRRRSE